MFDAGWETFHEQARGRWPNEAFVRFAMQRYGNAPDRSAVKFLELGCGAGAQLRFIAEEGFEAHGVDGSSAAIDRAYARAPLQSYRLYCEDITVWQPVIGFDCILDICTMQHLPDPDAVAIITKARGWLKPGGRFFSVMLRDAVGYAFPAPVYPRTKMQVENMFPGFDVVIGKQIEDRTDGVTISHWIIEAQVST